MVRQGRAAVQAAGGPAVHVGLSMVVVMTGVLITAVDTTIVVLALPEIERDLHVALASVIWIIIGYLLVITVLATQVGRLGDMFGRVRMYEAGFLIFVLGSMACALAWNDASIIGYLIGGVVFLALFVLAELRQREPMLDLSLLKIPTMAPSLLAALFQGLANFAVLFLVIMYLQGPRGLSPLHASLLLVPGYIVGSAIGPLAGRVADRVGPVIPATAGLGIQVIALFIYAQLSLTSGLWLVVAGSVVNGIGASAFFPANSSAVMKASPPTVLGISSGMLRTFANIGMVFSFAVAILIASHSISRSLAFAIFVGTTSLHGHLAAAFTTGLHAAFYTLMAFMVLAAVLSAVRGRPAPAPGGQPVTEHPART